MSRQLLVLEEVLVMLEACGATSKFIERFQKQAAYVHKHKPRQERDEITVSSGFGKTSGHGHVELTLNDQLTQMDVTKAREVGLMLLQAAEAAISDEALVLLIAEMGLPEEARGPFLMKIRELRQGTRDVVNPS